ncbi:type II restriction endonuclease [Streptococcus mutans]|uniref:TaqI-like C-terminal specificity domain-containing protein n=1 Tax=Streptococcus mutans TaxID=1309 RepID=UPI0021666660|nr:TaqI-like C-terminal specificity domain-containing protein [Streptococcus mutans]UVT93537.1 type II restriction endonuclease [Streptococcus mutans]UVT95407.1 type II restriction endonuclease [Streptococcus mutans]BBC56771.1 type IIS restriction/modification enzyme [Streptococcus mutans LP13]
MSSFQLSSLVFLQILQFQIADFPQSVYQCSLLYIHKSFLYTCFHKRSDYIKQNTLQISFNKDDSWIILSPIEQSIKHKIESVGTPLKDWNIRINRGILTGYNEAFIIDKAKRNELIEQDPKSAEIIRPILRGKDIRRYSYDFANKYLITTYNEYTDSNEIKHPSININDYPAVKKHLDCYWNEINKRQDKGDTPYNLRRCAYMDDFNKPKIAWNRIASKKSFGLIDEGIYIQDSMHFITGENIEYLAATLNSSLFIWLMNSIVGESAGGNAGNADNVKNLRILKPTNEIDCKITELLKNNDSESIDRLINQLYLLTEEEIQFISSSVKL